ncbi:hypothetical protein [Chitinimonas koreensis]|uniref:spermine/spermidine synthase domain-containing protein n=1 Tax=Chitinimonas koreensis TaxID=356302 RepID=UPI0003F60ADB|nr:hypothetical protein [Chitinimonas koreensis]QNM98420.1 hypothetical protein H9L41_09410 [Chitinimonas koreensis]
MNQDDHVTRFIDWILAGTDRPEKPFVMEFDGTLSLHFEPSIVQSQMNLETPDLLVLNYTQAMMGFLLLQPAPARMCQIGLGGGSLAKFCYRYLPGTDLDVVEINPDVIALRDRFRVPKDDARFRVVPGDGAEHVESMRDRYDTLLVDGFTEHGLPTALSTRAFYQGCHDALCTGGVLVVNLAAGDGMPAHLIDRIHRVFRGQIAVVQAEDSWNVVVFAMKDRPIRQAWRQLSRRADALAARMPVDLHPVAASLVSYFRSGACRNDDLPASSA